MHILLVDDEILLLNNLKTTVSAVAPEAVLHGFTMASEALTFAEDNPIDIAFLDISMRVISGIDLAKKLQFLYPKINIIFCTGFAEYAMEAHGLHASGYLLKPVNIEEVQDALNNLRYPITEHSAPTERKKRVEFRCFGHFDVTIDNAPVHFKYEKTRELLAYLVDRQGVPVTMAEIISVLWEDDEHLSYLKSLRRDLFFAFEEAGCDNVLNKMRGKLGIVVERVSCDFYDWQEGKLPASAYTGEYMTQYSWAEYRNGQLMKL